MNNRIKKNNIKLSKPKKTKKMRGGRIFSRRGSNSSSNSSSNNTKNFGGHKGDIINGYSIIKENDVFKISKNGVNSDSIVYYEIIYMNNTKEIRMKKKKEQNLGELPPSDEFKEGTKLILKKVYKDTTIVDEDNDARDKPDKDNNIQDDIIFQDRELAFREYIESSYVHDEFKKHMIRHIPRIVVRFKNKPEIYMIQKSVVQKNGFLLDIKIGYKTAYWCDRGPAKALEASLFTNRKLISETRKQGWRIESLRAIPSSGNNNISKKFTNLKKSRKKICGQMSAFKYFTPFFWKKRSKMKWYSCTSEYLTDLLKELNDYKVTIKLGDFGHPYLKYQNDGTIESFTKNEKCSETFDDISENFKSGIKKLKTSFNNNNNNNNNNIIAYLSNLKDLAFIGSSLMIAFEKPVHESNSEYSLEKIRDELKELIENFKKTRLVL